LIFAASAPLIGNLIAPNPRADTFQPSSPNSLYFMEKSSPHPSLSLGQLKDHIRSDNYLDLIGQEFFVAHSFQAGSNGF